MDKEQIKNLIQELIEKTDVKTNSISIIENDANNTWFGVEVSEPHFFTECGGEALGALNHLVKRIIESKTIGEENPKSSIIIDINGFQKKRVDDVRAIAHMMGERARHFKANIEVDPMTAFERRIVHEFLADSTDLKTESMGFGPTRRVVIKYIGAI